MRGVNKVTLLGNLGKDPEIQYLPGNIAVAKLSVATTEAYRDKNGKPATHTEWHHVTLWRGLAENADRYLKKGSTVYIEGKLRTKSWEDSTGHKKTMTEIAGDVLIMPERKQSDDAGKSDLPDFIPPVDEDGNERLPF